MQHTAVCAFIEVHRVWQYILGSCMDATYKEALGYPRINISGILLCMVVCAAVQS